MKSSGSMMTEAARVSVQIMSFVMAVSPSSATASERIAAHMDSPRRLSITVYVSVSSAAFSSCARDANEISRAARRCGVSAISAKRAGFTSIAVFAGAVEVVRAGAALAAEFAFGAVLALETDPGVDCVPNPFPFDMSFFTNPFESIFNPFEVDGILFATGICQCWAGNLQGLTKADVQPE